MVNLIMPLVECGPVAAISGVNGPTTRAGICKTRTLGKGYNVFASRME